MEQLVVQRLYSHLGPTCTICCQACRIFHVLRVCEENLLCICSMNPGLVMLKFLQFCCLWSTDTCTDIMSVQSLWSMIYPTSCPLCSLSWIVSFTSMCLDRPPDSTLLVHFIYLVFSSNYDSSVDQLLTLLFSVFHLNFFF